MTDLNKAWLAITDLASVTFESNPTTFAFGLEDLQPTYYMWVGAIQSNEQKNVIHYFLHNCVGYTMGKAEEWGNPVIEEALVRQGNDKCYQHRKPASQKN